MWHKQNPSVTCCNTNLELWTKFSKQECFNCLLNADNEDSAVMEAERQFHARPVISRNERSLMVQKRSRVHWRETQKSLQDFRLISPVQVAGKIRECHVVTTERKTITASTLNQCRSWSRWVIWSYFCVWPTRRTAPLSTD